MKHVRQLEARIHSRCADTKFSHKLFHADS